MEPSENPACTNDTENLMSDKLTTLGSRLGVVVEHDHPPPHPTRRGVYVRQPGWADLVLAMRPRAHSFVANATTVNIIRHSCYAAGLKITTEKLSPNLYRVWRV